MTRGPHRLNVRALIFDFDGLLVDTEQAAHQSWVELYASFGQQFPTAEWLVSVGSHDGVFDGLALLQKVVGRDLDTALLDAHRRNRKHDLASATVLMPGAMDWIEGAHVNGLCCAIASNSSAEWVNEHLVRLGIDHYFDLVETPRSAAAPKPAPDVHRGALDRLGLRPDAVVAIEDSPTGLQGALGAGLCCIVVPNPLLRRFSYPNASLVLDSLESMSLTAAIGAVEAR